MSKVLKEMVSQYLVCNTSVLTDLSVGMSCGDNICQLKKMHNLKVFPEFSKIETWPFFLYSAKFQKTSSSFTERDATTWILLNI